MNRMRLITIIVELFDRCKKIIDYIPLLWNDRDWDYYHILNMLHFKLKRVHKEIYVNPIHEVEGIEEEALLNCIKALEDIMRDDDTSLFKDKSKDIQKFLDNFKHVQLWWN